MSIDVALAEIPGLASGYAARLPAYFLSESELGMGASFGNSVLWIHTKGNGAIERVFSNEIGRSLLGGVSVRYAAHARLFGSDLSPADVGRQAETYTGIFPANGSRRFEIHPAYQRTSFELAGVLSVEETTFLPFGACPAGTKDPPMVYIIVSIRNDDAIAHPVRLSASAMLRGTTPPDVRAAYDEQNGALLAFNASHPEWVRVLGFSEKPTAYGANLDIGAAYDPSRVRCASDNVDAQGDLIGHLQLDFTMEPQERREIALAIHVCASGTAQALSAYSAGVPAARMLAQTIEQLENQLRCARVLTPDQVINEGALWSKVNMRRVMASYSTGRGFTNDPGKYAYVVVRDCAWFVYGNDHFLPNFSQDVLDNIASRQYASGKMPEYFDADDGSVEDYGLNINDDTPLYILAVNHHSRASGDVDWLTRIYPSVARAARYIISQMDDRGLVFCTANDPRGGVWTIAGWRNIIAEYKINGAVTELNAECVAALRAASHLAENLGGHEDDAREFARASERMKVAMEQHLINPDNGLYYLNIDVEGNPHTDVTGDEIFPVIMRACSDDVAFRILTRLNYPDFWTAAGLRTVSRYDPRFDPAASSGLLGGVWPGLTWWYAFGAARYHPQVMVNALRSSFAHYGTQPKQNNTVPGQFSEWFDGESLENRGMRLSPWEPPRFLWAAIEGVCGLVLRPDIPRVSPLIPAHWSWVGLRELPFQGSLLSYFIVREPSAGFRIYSTTPVDSDWELMLYERDVSDLVRIYADGVVVIALARDSGAVLLLGNSTPQTVHAPVTMQNLLPVSLRLHVRGYDSERRKWEDAGELTMEEFSGKAVTIEAGGFRLVEFAAV